VNVAAWEQLAVESDASLPSLAHGGERLPSSIRYIVLHSTEGDTAREAAEWFMRPEALASANLVVDDDECFRCLGDHVVPAAAAPLNQTGFHIEQAGYSTWSRVEWLEHEATVERAAWKAARRCRFYRIPPRLLDAAALRRDFGTSIDGETGDEIPVLSTGGVPNQRGPLAGGVVLHSTIDQAYATTLDFHADPGGGYPIDVFMAMLEAFLAL
jgi:hypothetical protein